MHDQCRGIFCSGCARLAILCSLPGLFLVGCGGPRTIVDNVPQLSKVTVAPTTPSVALGEKIQVTATGIFSDGSSKDVTETAAWTTGSPRVASISPSGLVTSRSIGTSALTASTGSLSATTNLTVSKAALASLTVGPSSVSTNIGTTTQLKATGLYTDGSSQDVTTSVTWTSSEPGIAAVADTGIATAKAAGAASLTASSGSSKASCQLTVLPAALVSISVSSDRTTIPLGSKAQFTALGTYSDGSKHDLTSSATWSNSPAGIVTIDVPGLATGRAIGTARVKAAAGSIEGTGTLNVSAAQLVSIDIAADKAVMPLGTSQLLAAQGAYTDRSTKDLTKSVSWSSDSATSVDVAGSGEAVAKALGSATITATTAGISGRVALTVSSPALISITVSPDKPTILLAGHLQLGALGSFTDGAKDITSQVTWTVDDPAIAGIGSDGDAIALKVGSTSVQANLSGVVGATTLIVQPVAFINYFSSALNGSDFKSRWWRRQRMHHAVCIRSRPANGGVLWLPRLAGWPPHPLA